MQDLGDSLPTANMVFAVVPGVRWWQWPYVSTISTQGRRHLFNRWSAFA